MIIFLSQKILIHIFLFCIFDFSCKVCLSCQKIFQFCFCIYGNHPDLRRVPFLVGRDFSCRRGQDLWNFDKYSPQRTGILGCWQADTRLSWRGCRCTRGPPGSSSPCPPTCWRPPSRPGGWGRWTCTSGGRGTAACSSRSWPAAASRPRRSGRGCRPGARPPDTWPRPCPPLRGGHSLH